MGLCLEPPQFVTGVARVPNGITGGHALVAFEQYERHTAWDRPGGVAERSGAGDLLEIVDDESGPWESLAHDTGMMLGDEVIARYPSLEWRLHTGSPRNLAYQHTVVMGYTRAPRGFNINPGFGWIGFLRTDFLGNEPPCDALARMIEEADRLA